jgi:hypothetical protein
MSRLNLPSSLNIPNMFAIAGYPPAGAFRRASSYILIFINTMNLIEACPVCPSTRIGVPLQADPECRWRIRFVHARSTVYPPAQKGTVLYFAPSLYVKPGSPREAPPLARVEYFLDLYSLLFTITG